MNSYLVEDKRFVVVCRKLTNGVHHGGRVKLVDHLNSIKVKDHTTLSAFGGCDRPSTWHMRQ